MERVPLRGRNFEAIGVRFRFDGGTGDVVIFGNREISRVRGIVEFQCNGQIVGSLQSSAMSDILRHDFPPRPEPADDPSRGLVGLDKTVFRAMVDICHAPSSLLHLSAANGPVRTGRYEVNGHRFLVQAYQDSDTTHILSCGTPGAPIDFRQAFTRLRKIAERKWPAPVEISDGWLSLARNPVDFRRGKSFDLAIVDARGDVHTATLTFTERPPFFHFDLHEPR